MRTGSMLLSVMALGGTLGVAASPAMAEPRWLACKFTDQGAQTQNFSMVFDDIRGTASLFVGGALVEGSGTSINYQSIRTRFPTFSITYNRNDGALSLAPEGSYGGILKGECRRSPPPPGAPAG